MTRETPKDPHPAPDAPHTRPEAAEGVTPVGTAVPAGARPRPSVPPSDEERIESGFDNMPV